MSSNSRVAISVNNIDKCYQIYDASHDRLKQFIIPRLQRLIKQQPKQYFREFWALKGISIDVRKGETVGIIGRNGSGKSTLLQIICGTLHPTTGDVEINGRVAALLELGSGFNPEFTGRENVYLNAGVLGLSQEQTNTRFADIEEFADIGDFIDQPVKTYSSGMMVRLAFAVIAHVDADILIIDEALAVGDALFTQKCMRFLRSFMGRGTVLFVSHDNASVKNLCDKVVWLENGRVREEGRPADVCDHYLQYTLQGVYGEDIKLQSIINESENTQPVATSLDSPQNVSVSYKSKAIAMDNLVKANGWKSGAAEIISVVMEKIDSKASIEFEGGERVRMVLRARANEFLSSPILGFIVKDSLGQELFGENTVPFSRKIPSTISVGQEFSGEFVFRLPMLQNGQYVVMASLANGTTEEHVHHHYVHDAFIINVYSSQIRFGIVGIAFESTVLKVH